MVWEVRLTQTQHLVLQTLKVLFNQECQQIRFKRFSIVTWAGATGGSIGHGLGGIRNVVYKRLASGTNHIVYHRGCSSGYFLKWNLPNAQDNANNYMTSQDADKLVFSNSDHVSNSSGENYVGYFWRENGFSRMGRYQGNGSTNEPMYFVL